MNNLYIANVRADYPESIRAKTGFIEGIAKGSDTTSRFLWHARAGDIVILPEQVDHRYVSYVCEMLELQQDTLHIIEHKGLLNDKALLEGETFAAIQEAVDSNSSIVIHPFVQTRGTVQLTQSLGIPKSFGAAFAHENGVDLLNSKANFRRIAAGVGLPIAYGFVARSRYELYCALRELIKTEKPLIAKHDHAGGGHGNIILAKEGTVRSILPGARIFFNIEDPIDDLTQMLWDELTDESYSVVTLEVYEESRERFYLEYDLTTNFPFLVANGGIRYNNNSKNAPPKWTGLDIPSSLDSIDSVAAASLGQRIISAVHSIGYRGMLNLDGIVTTEGKIIFQEINARWGGGLVYDVIARRLLGEDYLRTHALRSLLDLPKIEHTELRDRLTKAGVHYSRERKHGALILASRSDLGNGAEILLIAPKGHRIDEIELKVREAVTLGDQ